MLSRELAEFVAKDMRALEVLMSLKHTLIPDEFYFQLLAKSFDFPVIDDSSHRWINWRSVPYEQMVWGRCDRGVMCVGDERGYSSVERGERQVFY